jgi:GNAT superfamily N-acetyltransferase
MPVWEIRRLSDDESRPPFDCGDDDLNEFFAKDSIQSSKELLSVTYVVEADNTLAAFFSLSNDAIKKDLMDNPKQFKKLTSDIPRPKRYSTMPAVKIGRLATAVNYQSTGVGSELLDFLKHWFTDGNKTGCRFIVVDAYNKPKAINFYQKNGFSFLLASDEDNSTRLMFFDLKKVRQ